MTPDLKVVKLETKVDEQRKDVLKVIAGLQKAFDEGRVASIAVVYYQPDKTPFTWISDGMQLDQLAYAAKLMDRHLDELLDTVRLGADDDT